APRSSYSRTGRSGGPERSVAQPSSANVRTSRCDGEAVPDVHVPARSRGHAPVAGWVTAEPAKTHAAIAAHGAGREAAAGTVAASPLRLRVRNALRLAVAGRSGCVGLFEHQRPDRRRAVDVRGERVAFLDENDRAGRALRTVRPGDLTRFTGLAAHCRRGFRHFSSPLYTMIENRLERRRELLARRRARQQRERRLGHALVRNMQAFVALLHLLEE